jgi:hypothetical protein
MEEKSISREDYIQKILDAYTQTPGTTGMVRRPDRLLAGQLHGRGIPLCAVENAFVLATSRRLIRPRNTVPLNTIRSLAYFLPVIEEVLELRINPEYFQYLRHKIKRFLSTGR